MTALACIVDGVNYSTFTDNTIFGDSSSSCHIKNTLEGMFDAQDWRDTASTEQQRDRPRFGGEDLHWRTSKTCARKDRSQAVNVSGRRLMFGDSFDGGSRQVGRQE